MPMVTVVARQTFPYAGVTRQVGDAFEASVEDARILTLIGRVEWSGTPSTEDEPRAEPSPRRRRLRTEPPIDTLVE